MARSFAPKISKTTIGVAAAILGSLLIAPQTFAAKHDKNHRDVFMRAGDDEGLLARKGRETVQALLAGLEPPEISETNLYDALIAMPGLMKPASGRPAIIVVTSCVDTFSKANFEDALQAPGRTPFPIYAISLVNPLRLTADLQGPPALQRVNWNEAENKLQQIARASGGRVDSPKMPGSLLRPMTT